jgi:ketosteroid isomerase-like protein
MTHSLPAPLATFINATNSGDTEAFLDAFSEDAFLSDWGREFHGRDGVASWNKTDNIGKQAHFEVQAVDTSEGGAAVTLTLVITGNGYNGTGPLKFRLDGDRITSLIIE